MEMSRKFDPKFEQFPKFSTNEEDLILKERRLFFDFPKIFYFQMTKTRLL